MSSGLNALVPPIDCFEVASNTEQNFLEAMAENRIIPTYEQSFNVFAAAFDSCEEASQNVL